MAICVVCHDPVGLGGILCAAKCGHVLHRSCWIMWLESDSSCPECRRSISEVDLIRLYLNQDDEIELVDPKGNNIDSLPLKMRDLIKDPPESVQSEQHEVIVEDSEEVSFSLDDSNAEVIVVKDSDSSLGSGEERIGETKSASESEIVVRPLTYFVIESKESINDESESEESVSGESEESASGESEESASGESEESASGESEESASGESEDSTSSGSGSDPIR